MLLDEYREKGDKRYSIYFPIKNGDEFMILYFNYMAETLKFLHTDWFKENTFNLAHIKIKYLAKEGYINFVWWDGNVYTKVDKGKV